MTDTTANLLEHQRAAAVHRKREARGAQVLAKRLGLRLVAADALSIRRRRCGKGWTYLDRDNRVIRDPAIVRRLASLAVPPAYVDVLYAEDAAAHLQAIGRDAAGRLQYRYHPDWEKVREMRKARRLARLADVLPRIRRSVAQHLAGDEPTREFALGGGDRTGRAQRHPPRQRKLCAPARHARRRHAAQVERHRLRRDRSR